MNTTVKAFLQDDKFIIAFLIGCLLLGMFASEKALIWFLILVLTSMVILNAGKFSALLGSTKISEAAWIGGGGRK